MTKKNLCLLGMLLFAAVSVPGMAQTPPNILFIIGDDMGVETLAAYGLGETPPATAALDELAREGVRFSNFWSQPVCSPTRATLLTGRYGFRTGIGRPITGGPSLGELPEKPDWATYESSGAPGGGGMGAGGMGMGMGMGAGGMGAGAGEDDPAGHGLLSSEYTLPKAFKAHQDLGYATAAFGKWHLADEQNGWLKHPNLVGFDHYSGLMTGATPSFFAWNKNVDGRIVPGTGYTPVNKADDAIAWIAEHGDQPWFVWFAFNLVHTPLHLPPKELWQSDHSDLDPQSSDREQFRAYFTAMMEAMDTQIARLLAALDPEVRENTYVIFIGDNGTTSGSVSAPFRAGRAKGTIYEGGVNVPLIVTGPGVARGAVADVLVNSTDLFATIMDMAGIDPATTVPPGVTTDSISFHYALSDPNAESRREWIYADVFAGGFAGVEGANYAMRNGRYKLLRNDGAEEFYDLREDPYEYKDLLTGNLSSQQNAEYRALQAQIATLRSSP